MFKKRPEFSIHTRTRLIEKLKNEVEQYDVAVIGGGIVGAGVLREFALRGKKAILIEQNDFASGTSSKSSKLIHGGLRYLEMLDFKLVFEALGERHWLLTQMPHLVRPLEFNLPLYNKENAPKGMRPPWMLRLGLWLYDGLTLGRTPFFHGSHSREQAIKLFPGIKKDGFKGTLYYADAMFLDDELVLECIYDAVRSGAEALNYIKVEKVSSRKENGFFELQCSEGIRIEAKEVSVCVGPWTEKISPIVSGGSVEKLKPSLGSHLVFPWKKLPVEHCMVMFEGDGRIIFVIPRKDLGPGAEKTIVGTTDSPFKEDPSLAKTPRADIEYLMSVLKKYFGELNLTEDDMTTTYVGVRPLVDESGKTEAKTSREHKIWKNKEGIVFMSGGKYTTFRTISEEIAEYVFPGILSGDHISKRRVCTQDEYEMRQSGEMIWGRFSEGFIRWKIRHHCPMSFEDLITRRVPVWMDGEKVEPKVIERLKQIWTEETAVE